MQLDVFLLAGQFRFGIQVGHISAVFLQNGVFHRGTRLAGDGVGHIPKGAVFILAAGHGHKQPFRPLDDLDIVNGQVAPTVTDTSAFRRVSW